MISSQPVESPYYGPEDGVPKDPAAPSVSPILASSLLPVLQIP